MITGLLRDWLEANRDDLNRRVRLAQRRFPMLSIASFSAALSRLLPMMAGNGEPGTEALLSHLYDLLLLQVGRQRFRDAAIERLYFEGFPRMRPLLLQKPSVLAGALSNAAENLGDAGDGFVKTLLRLSSLVQSADELLDAGVVLAWRKGEARLRTAALARAERLPSKVVLEALELFFWPVQMAPLVVKGLGYDAWARPEAVWSEAFREKIQAYRVEQLGELVESFARPVYAQQWKPSTSIGAFAGFDGSFEEPPLLLQTTQGRHRFWAKSGAKVFVLEADCYGWRCVADSAQAGEVSVPMPSQRQLLPAELQGHVSSALVAPSLLLYTEPDSFRIRVMSQERVAR